MHQINDVFILYYYDWGVCIIFIIWTGDIDLWQFVFNVVEIGTIRNTEKHGKNHSVDINHIAFSANLD